MCSNMNKLNNILYRIWPDMWGMLLLFLIIGFMTGCAASKRSLSSIPRAEPDANASSHTGEQSGPSSIPASSRPSVSWQPSFTVEDIQVKESKLGLPELKVGANIESQSGKVLLRDIIRGLANLKDFNVSWNKDANPNAMVDVDIKADDDFWIALDNVLRQLDYFFEFKNDTLIIGYKQTKTYQVSMPNVSYTFTTAVGGNMLGGPTNTSNIGEISLATVPPEKQEQILEEGWATEKTMRYVNRYDLWKTFRQNIDQILEIWQMQSVERATLTSTAAQASQETQKKEEQSQGNKGKTEKPTAAMSQEWVSLGKGSYTVDESLGIVTVNASPSLQKRVTNYIDTFKSWLYRQVSIQANILEVTLSEGSSRGIDWSKVFKAVERETALISGGIEYGKDGNVYEVNYPEPDLRAVTQRGLRLISKIHFAPTDFKLLVNALDEQGKVHTLSEPRLNLLNGSPGVLTVGESIRYIREVTAMRSGDSGDVDYTVVTDDILSGIAFSVVCNVLGDDEVVLYLTPVTSQLKKPIEYKTFGEANMEVGLPEIKLRQMSTMAKVRDGDLLILGGLIDEVSENSSSEIPLLGKIPWVKWAFRNEIKSKERRELVIILRPHILPI